MLKNTLKRLSSPRVQRPLFCLLLLMVTYLSLKPGCSVQEEIWLPSRWGLWLDIYDGWKNGFGFGTLALAAFFGWPQGWGSQRWPLLVRRLTIGLCCVMLVAIFEG